jgi:hypothetical protein
MSDNTKCIYPLQWKEIKNNPSQFGSDTFTYWYEQHGMTLREYYAGIIIQGMMSNSSIKWTPEDYASEAVKIADTLIIEINKTDNNKKG